MNKPLLYLILTLGCAFSSIPTVFADQGITNPVHGKNVGKIIWSKQGIDFKSPNASAFVEKFSAGDHIYGRVYQEKALNNFKVYNNDKEGQNRDGGYQITAKIDGKPVELSFGVFHDGNLSGKAASHWTTWRFSPYPKNPDQGFEQDISGKWVKAIRKLSPGDHKVEFELWGTQGQYKTKHPVASGSFVLALAAGDKVASAGKFPSDVYSGADKTGLKQKIKKALIGPVTKNGNEITNIAIRSEWKRGVYTKVTPRKEYRKLTAAILWVDKNNDQLCRYTSYNFIQDKSGNSWTPVRFHGFCNGCEEGEVECAQ
jgi:hypothetical protein